MSENQLKFSESGTSQRSLHPQINKLDQYYPQGSIPFRLIKVVERLLQKPTTFEAACGIDIKINYLVFKFENDGFIRPQGASLNQGAVVILPGRGEASFKYVETAYDLYNLGYGPIYVIDHRGQGLSSRIRSSLVNGKEIFFPLLQTDDHIGHLDSFDCFTYDFSKFIRDIVSPKHPIRDISFIAHSTGGAVLMNYFDYAVKKRLLHPQLDLIPRRIALTSPMLNLDSRSNMAHQFFSHPGGSLFSLNKLIRCQIENGCVDILKKNTFDSSLVFNSNDESTTSKERYLFYRLMMNFWPQAIIDSITTAWIQEARKALRSLNAKPQAWMDTKVVLFKAGQDSVVDNGALNEFCKIRANLLGACRLDESLSSARHAMLTEQDSIRNSLMTKIHQFFQERN